MGHCVHCSYMINNCKITVYHYLFYTMITIQNHKFQFTKLHNVMIITLYKYMHVYVYNHNIVYSTAALDIQVHSICTVSLIIIKKTQ